MHLFFISISYLCRQNASSHSTSNMETNLVDNCIAYDAAKTCLWAAVFVACLLGCTNSKQVDNHPVAEGSDSIMVAKGYDEIELYKTRTGHITTTIKVNGKSCVFLIDTGGGATLIDRNKKEKFGLTSSGTSDYAAGISSRSSLVRTSATFQVNGQDITVDELYLMDITYINSEFRKNRSKQVDGVLGTDFLAKYGAVIDYAQSKLFIKIR